MSISIIGICGLEWYWVAKAVKEKTTEFDRSALRAMHASVSELENAEVASIIADAMGPASSFELVNETIYELKSELAECEEEVEPHLASLRSLSSDLNQTINERVELLEKTVWANDGADHNVSVNMQFADNGAKEGEEQRFIEIKASSKETSSFKVEEGVLKRKLAVIETAMTRVLVEEIKSKPNIKSRIGDTDLDSLLHINFVKQGIDMPFTFFVKGANSQLDTNRDIDEITNVKAGAMNFSVPLFPDFPEEFALIVGFPTKQVFVLKSLGGLLLLVLVFSLLMVATYIKTVHAMLRQKRLSEVKSDFINNMTHEFKTPLATIGLALDSINHPSVYANPNEITRFTGIIAQENKRLNGHVEKILQLAKMEKGELILNKDWFDLGTVILHVASSMELGVKARDGRLICEIPEESTKVFADESHLRNVLVNLVDNALKYTISDPFVTITCKMESYYGTVIVTDNGVGMNPEVQRKAFNTFYRAQSGNLHNVKGFGLGLSYMREVIHLHQGELLLSSHTGKGTSIGFRIPLGNG